MKRSSRKVANLATHKPPLPRIAGYATLLTDLKQRIRTAQIRAALSVNRELIQLHWDVGRAIVDKQRQQGWGTAVIDKLAADLQREFPDLSGFSRSNIYRMRGFYLAYAEGATNIQQAIGHLSPKSSPAFVPQTVGQIDKSIHNPIVSQPARQIDKSSYDPIVSQAARQLGADLPPEPMASLPWFHNVVLLESLSDPATRFWYARKTLEHGWSRSMRSHWIDSKLHARQGKAITNFKTTLPPEKSDLAIQILKDLYNFDFLTLHRDALEKDLESGLLEHITRFLIELGEGFAFVGRQVRFEVDGEDFSIDLLFYHVRLHAYVVIDLKTGKFLPEHAGKMNFYLSMVDDQRRTAGDAPTIGLILCRTRSKIIAEYALRHTHRPVGVAGYEVTLTDKLPKEFAGRLPTIKQIERELSRPSKPTSRKRNR